MVIKQVDRKHKTFNELEFSSFRAVREYVLETLATSTPSVDDRMFAFKILDSDEVFVIYGKAYGEDSCIHGDIEFIY